MLSQPFCDQLRATCWHLLGWIAVLAFTSVMLDLGAPDNVHAQIVSVGKAKYRNDLPVDQDGRPRRTIEAVPSISQHLKRSGLPVPSNDWCSSLVWPKQNRYSLPMFAHPLAMQAHSDGLGMGYNPIPQVTDSRKDGRVIQAGTDYRYPYRESLIVGLKGMQSESCVLDRYSDWTVTALWRDSAADQTKDSALRATFGHGLPFVYFKRTGDKPLQVRFTHAKVDRTGTPVDPIAFSLNDITGKHSRENSQIQLTVDAFKNVGVGCKARLSYDFDGDGRDDRVETFGLMATDPSPDSWEIYESDAKPLDPRLTYGEFADFRGGSAKLELWKCFGEGDLRLDLSRCNVQLPIEDGQFFLREDNSLSRQPAKGVAVLAGEKDAARAQVFYRDENVLGVTINGCLLYTSPSPRDQRGSRMPSSA